jgi:hypothetical protein
MVQFVGLYTSGMSNCCHIIVRNKVTHDAILCHADALTDLKYYKTGQNFGGLKNWIESIYPNGKQENYSNLEVNIGETAQNPRIEDESPIYYNAVVAVLLGITGKNEAELLKDGILVAQKGNGKTKQKNYSIGIKSDGSIAIFDFEGFFEITDSTEINIHSKYETHHTYMYPARTNAESAIKAIPPYPVNKLENIFDEQTIKHNMKNIICFGSFDRDEEELSLSSGQGLDSIDIEDDTEEKESQQSTIPTSTSATTSSTTSAATSTDSTAAIEPSIEPPPLSKTDQEVLSAISSALCQHTSGASRSSITPSTSSIPLSKKDGSNIIQKF